MWSIKRRSRKETSLKIAFITRESRNHPPPLLELKLCWRRSNRAEARKRKDNRVQEEKSWKAKGAWWLLKRGGKLYSFFLSFLLFFFSTWYLDSWFLVFIHRDVWILSFRRGFYPSLHRASNRSCYGRKDVFSFFDHPWFKWIRDEVGLSARHVHVDLCVSSLNGPLHDVFLARWRFEWWWKEIFRWMKIKFLQILKIWLLKFVWI